MKHFAVVAALMASSASAQTWKTNYYCDYEQFVIEEKTSTAEDFSIDQCFEWCVATDKVEGSNYQTGEDMCCDYEEWSDGSFNCYLYAGGNQIKQDMNDYPDDVFNSVVFPHMMPQDTAAEEEGASYMAAGAAALVLAAALF